MDLDELILKVSEYIRNYQKTILHLPNKIQNIKRLEMLQKMYKCTVEDEDSDVKNQKVTLTDEEMLEEIQICKLFENMEDGFKPTSPKKSLMENSSNKRFEIAELTRCQR